MAVKTQFSIKDLENLSGVKAHTIRIWEKRYNLLQPNRTDTNIRTYGLDSLKKILNVSILYNEGYKISKIASLSEKQVERLVENQAEINKENHALNIFKTAMFKFDEQLFSKTYSDLVAEKSFREVFFNVFVPLLNEIGLLWQSGTIEPSHESFISELLKRKVLVNIEREINNFVQKGDTTFILFLPYKEIHEIGLLYTNYEILSSGFKTIYLGSNIPLNSLSKLLNISESVIFLSYVTMAPEGKNINDYLESYQKHICNEKTSDLWLMGSKVQHVDVTQISSNVSIIKGISDLSNRLDILKKA